jgi:hypothetical protein
MKDGATICAASGWKDSRRAQASTTLVFARLSGSVEL